MAYIIKAKIKEKKNKRLFNRNLSIFIAAKAVNI